MDTKLQSLSSRFASTWEENGPSVAVSRSIGKLCKPMLEVSSIRIFKGSPGDTACDPQLAEAMEISEAGPEDAEALLMDRPETTLAEEIRQRFARGDRCIVVRDSEGKCLHSRWLSTRPTYIPEIRRYVVPQHGQLYMYDGYTRAGARGKGIDGAVRRHIFTMAGQESGSEVFSYVHGPNRVGMKAAAKWQKEIGNVGYASILNRWKLLSGTGKLQKHITLLTEAELKQRENESRERARALDNWFESWLAKPMENRSTGYTPLPEPYFESAAAHIISTLELDPDKDEVLDVGCSSAVLSRRIAPFCRRFHGVDATPGLIEEIEAGSILTSSGEPAVFSVADARRLPYPDGNFTKVYCSGVIHMLPTYDDALQIVDELVRVCQPGGSVLLGAVPDRAKKPMGWRLLWRQSGLAGKAKLALALVTPRRLRQALHKLKLVPRNPIAFLEFDMQALKARCEVRGLECRILDYPKDYWSDDFRVNRSNLLISR